MDSPHHVNSNPAPAIVLTQDNADEDDEEHPGQHPRPDITRLGGGRLGIPVSSNRLPPNSGDPKSLSGASTPILSPSISFASEATHGAEPLFSPVLSLSSRSSLDGNGPFEESPESLGQLMEQRDLVRLEAIGGIDGLADRLVSHCTRGLTCGSECPQYAPSRPDAVRRGVFGSNRMPERKAKTIWACVQEAFRDRFLLLLLALSSLVIIMGLARPGSGNWVDGIPGVGAAFIVTIVSILASYVLDRKYSCILKMTGDRQVRVIRTGSPTLIPVHDVMVGDVITLGKGDLVPADGLLISGYNIKCDESCDTGESELVAKSGAPRQGESYMQYSRPERTHCDPFIISGSRVMEGGDGRCLVTGVGVNSIHGRLMEQVRTAEMEETPLQQRVGELTGDLTYVAIGVAVLMAIGLFARGVGGFKECLKIFELAVTIILVSVPEGLPMSVLTALISSWYGMHRDKNLVRKLSSCETMGNATTICCDKTGTLTMNEMSVTVGMIGTAGRFSEDPLQLSNSFTGAASSRTTTEARHEILSPDMSPETVSCLLRVICPQVHDLVVKSIVVNSTASEGGQNGPKTYIGSGTETALLRMARSRFGLECVRRIREEASVVQVFPFDSRRKCMATVTKLSDSLYRMYVKGAPEIILTKCDRTIKDPATWTEFPMTYRDRRTFLDGISKYGSRSLRTLGFAYRDFDSWPPAARPGEISEEADLFQHSFQNLVFLGLVGIQDPLRPGVREAVEQCKSAGITVRLVTGDSVATAQAVAASCGILDDQSPADCVWEGPNFRELSPGEMTRVLPTLRVLARSSPEDKKLIVCKLKDIGETVAVTGDGTNDGPALRAAHVGFAMGISGTEVAKEASSIVLLDDDFTSIVKAIAWGRSVYDAVRRFLQFQLTANVSVLGYTAVSAIHGGIENPSFFTTPQLLWINLIMDILGAVGLSTDGPDENILHRRPERISAPLLTIANTKMIIGQAAYQLLAVLAINLCREDLVTALDPSVDIGSERMDSLTKTLVFNTYICMLFFNLLNCRRPDNKTNILKGVTDNNWFIGTFLGIVFAQVLLICFGGRWLQVTRLNVPGWVISLCIGFMSVPLGMAIRCITDEPFLALEQRIAMTTATLAADSTRLHLQVKHGILSAYGGLVRLTTELEIKRLALVQRTNIRVASLGAAVSSLFAVPRRLLSPRPKEIADAEHVPDERTALLGDETV